MDHVVLIGTCSFKVMEIRLHPLMQVSRNLFLSIVIILDTVAISTL